MLTEIREVFFRKANARHAQYHIAAFFDGHLFIQRVACVLAVPEAKPIGLAVGKRIGARVVRRELIRPETFFHHLKDGVEHTFDQLGVVD